MIAALAASAGLAHAQPVGEATPAPAADAEPPRETASLRPPTEGAVLYQSPPPRTSPRGNRALYVGGAILLAAAVFLLLQRRGARAGSDREPREPHDE